MLSFDVQFTPINREFTLDFQSSETSFDVTFEAISVITELPEGLSFYDGEYVIVPILKDQTLTTTDKILKNDVTVKAIPYDEVSNSHGITVIIGG